MSMNFTYAFFNQVFKSITTTIEFNPEWSVDTVFFKKAVNDLTVTVKSKTTDPYGRKLIIVPTPLGNVVVFQRFKDSERVIACSAPEVLKELAGSMNLDGGLFIHHLEWIFGTAETNNVDIGVRVENLIQKAMKKEVIEIAKSAVKETLEEMKR